MDTSPRSLSARDRDGLSVKMSGVHRTECLRALGLGKALPLRANCVDRVPGGGPAREARSWHPRSPG